MSDIRYWVQLPTEQFPPSDLVRQAKAAEIAGFDALNVSDHYQPWWEPGTRGTPGRCSGRSASATSTIPIGTGVTAPRATATTPVDGPDGGHAEEMFPGRAYLGIGRASP